MSANSSSHGLSKYSLISSSNFFSSGLRDLYSRLINYNPLEYRSLKPVEKKIADKDKPPKLIVEFFDNQKNIKNINCYSNDGGSWGQPNLVFEKNILYINFESKFSPRRGRINCSLNDDGKWRWFGTQFVIMEN